MAFDLQRKIGHAAWRVNLMRLRLMHARAANRSEARRIFEQELLFSVRHTLAPRRILSVGVARYTQFYEQLFSGTTFETIDIDPANARWGSRQRHYVAPIAALPAQANGAKYDVVLFNGVYGWGVNSADELTEALAALSVLLADNGVMVFGWNCIPAKDPLGLGTDMSPYFQAFSPAIVDGVHTVHAEQSNGQRFRFLRHKRPGDPAVT